MLAPYLRLHQSGSHTICPTLVIPEAHPNQISGPPKLFLVAFPYEWLVLALASDFPKFSQTGSIWIQQAPYLSLSCPRPCTSSSWSWFTAWPLLGTSKPSTNSSYRQISLWLMLCEPNRTQVVADLQCAVINQGSTTRGGCTQPIQWAYLEHPGWVIGEAVLLDPTGYLLHQATLSSLGSVVALPNT